MRKIFEISVKIQNNKEIEIVINLISKQLLIIAMIECDVLRDVFPLFFVLTMISVID